MPNKKRERSVFRTDGKSREDVIAAGRYVVVTRKQKNLYGWLSSPAELFREHGLEIVCDPIKGTSLSCKHYNALCWPVKDADQADIAQKIADKVCVEDLSEPIPV